MRDPVDKDRVESWVMISTMLMQLFDGDSEKVAEWLTEENSYFFGYSPLEHIMLGREKSIIDFLKERLGWQ